MPTETTKTPAQPATFIRLTNQARDTKDLGLWDAEGAVPNPTGGMAPEERKKLNARRASAVHVRLGSMDDRNRPGALSPRSEPIPLEVFQAMVRGSAALRGWLKSTPAQITREVVQDSADLGLGLD